MQPHKKYADQPPRLQPAYFEIANIEEHKEAIDKLVSNAVYGVNHRHAIFRFDP